MFTAYLISKNKKTCKSLIILLIILSLNINAFAAQSVPSGETPSNEQTPSQNRGVQPSSDNPQGNESEPNPQGSSTQNIPVRPQPGASENRQSMRPGGPRIPGRPPKKPKKKNKYFEILLGPEASTCMYNISPVSREDIPETNEFTFSGGAFFDIRFNKRFGLKVSYAFQFGYRNINTFSFIGRYNLALKHQLWIGMGFTLHIADFFTSAENNQAAYSAGLISDINDSTEKRLLLFYVIAMGYYLEVSKLIVLDFEVSYCPLNHKAKTWQYQIFRIKFGVGFRL